MSASRGGPTEEELRMRIQRTIDREDLLGKQERIVVGLSGGPDSMALLHLLLDLRPRRDWDLLAVHIHHGIREEADQDAWAAQVAAEGAGVPFHRRSIFAGPNPSEDRLRRKRYHLLGSEALEFGATAVAVGHQRDDQAETVIQRVVRGTGIRGLAGIPYKRELPGSGGATLIRPLLDCSREEILAYLGRRKIPWQEDSTNRDPRYARNRIRHEVIPLLKEALNETVIDALSRLSILARDALQLLEAEGSRIYREGQGEGSPSGQIRVEAWGERSPSVIGEALRIAYTMAGGRGRDFSNEMVVGLIEAIRSGEASYETTWPGAIPVRLKDGRLLVGGGREGPVKPAVSMDVAGVTPCPWADLAVRSRLLSRQEMEAEGGPGRTAPHRVWFDWEALSPPLQVRSWAPGEKLRPFGGPTVKEVREVLADEKVPREDRTSVPVVADREGVIWIVDLRRSCRAPVTPTTSRVLALERIPLG